MQILFTLPFVTLIDYTISRRLTLSVAVEIEPRFGERTCNKAFHMQRISNFHISPRTHYYYKSNETTHRSLAPAAVDSDSLLIGSRFATTVLVMTQGSHASSSKRNVKISVTVESGTRQVLTRLCTFTVSSTTQELNAH
ncbi:uncharacterized protein LOC113464641 [Ceratina calcarata]|uniref:Uncharacterized protein LOC113464641 n=1 Tax=Ceratina calcarata TaxID=156304 RepID=A0AAJ7S4R7_9HYME|nr:uncharacterized protein LOC113464641 [Ceratina calcarata]